jgi:hypothetical protein
MFIPQRTKAKGSAMVARSFGRLAGVILAGIVFPTLVDGKYQIECDGGCGKVNYTGQRSFHQARNVSSAENWEQLRTEGGSWRNYCPRCAEEPNPDLDLTGVHFFKKSASE